MQTTLPQAARRGALPTVPDTTLARDHLWRTFWRPYWTWSDAPAPELASADAPLPAQMGLAGQAVVTGIDRIRRNLWISHAAVFICRGVWLGLLVAGVLMLIDLLGGPVFNPQVAGAVGVLLLVGGVVLAALSKPGRRRTAQMLDRSFRLHERLATALDDLGLGVPEPGARAPLVYLQVADAANAVAMLRADHRLRPALPVREMALVVIFALLLTVLAFARGLGGGLPALATARVPVFTPAIERPEPPQPTEAEVAAAAAPPTVQEVLERQDRSAQARRDLQQLATALSDHAATSQAAADISAGDYAAASEQLRQAAQQTANLSPEAKQALANDLRTAAEGMDPATNGLREASQNAAQGLEQDPAAANAGMRDLADAVERAGQDVVSQSDLASEMRSARQAQPTQNGISQPGSRTQAGGDQGDPSSSGAQASANSSDPGAGADASAGSDGRNEGSAQEQPGSNESGSRGEGSEAGGQQAGAGESGNGQSPGEGQSGGPGENSAGGQGAPGDEAAAGAEGTGDSQTARPGGGAGTGEAAEQSQDIGGASTSATENQAGETAAAPNVTEASTDGDGGGQGQTGGPQTGNLERVALPSTTGSQGVQTSADGGSALRGSGAGVTAGSGFATQGEVGEAGPDSNRVPPQHRDTVERYFGGGNP
ncbi:MAG: hypothetical protein JNM64_12155 [Chloroflexia bacterium]|nr:hypothetical protein [Chloroflexia bacterium]